MRYRWIATLLLALVLFGLHLGHAPAGPHDTGTAPAADAAPIRIY